MSARAFVDASRLDDAGLALALAPALTPEGLVEAPSFFHGFAAQPLVLARGLVALADITSTRYYKHVPESMRDPVLTAHGDRLRAECFSACASVHARLDLLPESFDSGEMRHGTTNVDIGPQMRTALTQVGRAELLHLDIGREGLAVATPGGTTHERPVVMPDRWVRGFGNAAEIHHGLPRAFEVGAAHARAFVAGLPPATGVDRTGWLVADRTGLRLSPRRVAGGVHVAGLHRLSAFKRLLTHVTGLVVHGTDEQGPSVVTLLLPGARFALGLTDVPWRGFSGEGSLLEHLAGGSALEDAELLAALLAFEPVLDEGRLARDSALRAARVRDGLGVLAASGRIGRDVVDDAWFHRELPHDPARVTKDATRLTRARRLLAEGAVESLADSWRVRTGDGPGYTVRDVGRDATCTCPWYLRHGTGRGPCAHILAVQLLVEAG
ncbi:SWIM zinc finger family protein [Sanguibacter sp. HDW7]|uniref:SWIM zinc finger family protein n=1 Tax=Sanguibacter sp. HDW7 TaxID=2714931 RepID=UPI001409C6A0|nr:SWIM zinc finger family protein [Sanguibacter sp. HDW7]QIK83872.1 SWIM zinc finger family protein [Sanguibacter sp. HDW7]